VSFLKALFFSVALAINFPKPIGLVNDFAKLFSNDFRSRLELQLGDLKAKTTVEFAVVTVNNLEGLTLEEYANDLFKAWGIGQKDKDNGLLLLISKNDKKIRFETGYGLEGALPDGRLGEIIRTQISPEFKNGNYEVGVEKAVNTVINYLEQGSTSPATTNWQIWWENLFKPGFFFFLSLLIYLLSYLSRSKEFFTGGVVGFFLGFVFGKLPWAIGLGFFGLILDYFLSKNYKNLVANGKPTGFWSSRGGFGGGGGFGGFGGGKSGGGGTSGGW
jgi:uncharacterized protein